MRHPAIMLCLVAATIVACGAGLSYATGATIIFCSDRDGDHEIYSMGADGSNVQQITFNTFDELGPACSPDGRRILFVSDRDGDSEIYIMNVDGSQVRRLTNSPGPDTSPSWSRDGSFFAFASERDGDSEIWVMDPDDPADLRQVTYDTYVQTAQDISPDGTRVVFHSDRGGSTNIWTVDLDGSNWQQLTTAAGGDFMPEYSPDGTQIVFESFRDGPLELYIMNADGSGVVRLTYNFSDNHEPDWSPDGSKIMYVSKQGNDYDIMLINPDRSGLQILTSASPAMDWGPSWLPDSIPDSALGGGTGMLAYCNQPVSGPDIHELYAIHIDGTQKSKIVDAAIGLNHHEWSPDGQKLAAVGYVDGSTWSIYTVDADGTNLTRLTTTAGVWDDEPTWSPDGTRLAWGRIYPSEGYRAEVWIMNSDGTDQHTNGVAGDGVKWSPDGARLVYFKELAGVDIWTCNVDGSGEAQLTSSSGNNTAPDWSPDGSKIVFQSTRDGNREIYIMDADGSSQQRITANADEDFAPTWSPDGSLIAFERDVTGANRWEVFVMDAGGGNERRVTYSPPERTAINPDWQPIDDSSTPVYLQGIFCTPGEQSVRMVWEVTQDAFATDFRLAADKDGECRTVPVSALGARRFEAVDDHPGLRAGGRVVYTLYALADDGGWDLLGTESVELAPPSVAARLTSVHPNPFNPDTEITFSVNRLQPVRIDIHDAAGRRVATLVDRDYAPGDYQIHWDGRDKDGREIASGVYFLLFKAGKSTKSRKLVLIR